MAAHSNVITQTDQTIYGVKTFVDAPVFSAGATFSTAPTGLKSYIYADSPTSYEISIGNLTNLFTNSQTVVGSDISFNAATAEITFATAGIYMININNIYVEYSVAPTYLQFVITASNGSPLTYDTKYIFFTEQPLGYTVICNINSANTVRKISSTLFGGTGVKFKRDELGAYLFIVKL